MYGPEIGPVAGLSECDEFVLLRSEADRLGMFERVDAVARLHAFDQVHFPGVVRRIDHIHACLVERHRVERSQYADVAHPGRFRMCVAVAVDREVVGHADVEYPVAAVVGDGGHRLEEIVLRGEVTPHFAGILRLAGGVYPRLACG